MPRASRADVMNQLDKIETLIRNQSGGIDVPAIRMTVGEALGRPLTERTLMRRLHELIVAGRVRKEGRTSATRYFTVRGVGPTPRGADLGDVARPVRLGEMGATDAPNSSRSDAEYVPVTPAGAEVRALVRRPMVARTPVGYREAFLRDYVPGTTWYLTESMRAALHEHGRTPDSERPAGTFAREIFERLLIDLAWASSRLEGNTYSRLDTKNLLEFGVRAEGKNAAEAQMILNHKTAIELLVEQAEVIGFNRYTFLNLHALLAENLLDDPAGEGRVRSRIIGITGTTYVPLSIPQKLDELFDLLLTKAAVIPDPFEQSFFVMVQLPYLQPFIDVNKRTSRLAANISLTKANLCPLSFVGVPERDYVEGTLGIYEHTSIELLRDVFMWAYERSCAQYRVVRDSMGEPDALRLRYRALLSEAVRDVVLGGSAPKPSELRAWAERHAVSPSDCERFTEIAFGLLLDLHEGAIVRYGLRPSEFEVWKRSRMGGGGGVGRQS